MITWRAVVQSYPCEACGAPPGAKCITVSGHRSYEPHQQRSNAASANHWRSPDDLPAPCGTLPRIDPTDAGVGNASSPK
jgi:hypothetical protein